MSDNSVPEIFLNANRFGIRLGLERMRALMQKLGDPQDKLSCIHVAGTNGKGSVVAYISSILAAVDRKVGVFTSPYLCRFSERIRILDGKSDLEHYRRDDAFGEISMSELENIGKRIETAVEQITSEGVEHPTEFELVTAAAFIYFFEKQCNQVVLETGLGGRLDSTNIIEQPVCSVITAVGYDHMDRLGETIGQIASEKAGIIKPDRPVFLLSPYEAYLQPNEALEAETVISEACVRSRSELSIVSSKDILIRKPVEGGQCLYLGFADDPTFIGHIGRHQALNATLAARSMRSIATEEEIREGLSSAVWKGRNEIVSQNPVIILDGAHNPQGMKAFCAALNESYGEQFAVDPPRIIFGVMRDKDHSEMISVLLRSVAFAFREIICVTVDQPRSLPAEELANAFRKAMEEHPEFYNRLPSMYNVQGEIVAFEDAGKACSEALSRSRADGAPIVCVGSLYLIGQVRGVFLKIVRR
ncbi:MAG: bifunctional folylpolyglutamate synthase/dihydrofolate synthase [Clostridiales bacterium]|nr:bifunctional folylpolyglutamate synthase/dihydrofolate synthase [Clostridiales bacterium]